MVLVAAADRRPFARATISSHLAKLHSLLFLAMQSNVKCHWVYEGYD